MLCPVCQEKETLLMSDRQGVEIDYCPKCRGVWLDRGELEKLIEMSMHSIRPTARRIDRQENDCDDDYRDRRDDARYQGHHGKRESWLSRILDFD